MLSAAARGGEADTASLAGFRHPAVAAGVEGLHRRYARGLDRPTDVLAAYTERIERLDGALHAFVDLDLAEARRAARASEARWTQGQSLSTLDGVPIGIKANIAVRGLPWTAGIGARRDHIATADADCVARLRAAGAIVLGSLNMDEAALGARTDNAFFGRTQNPHRHGHTAGGSSGGAAAAVAAGLCAAALGTDTIGSVRLPAAACGVVGLCPSAGTFSHEGVVALASAYDRIGVLARSLDDAVAVQRAAAAMPGGEAADAGSATGDEPVAAWRPSSELGLDDAVLERYRDTLDRLRATGIEIRWFDLDADAWRASLKDLLLVLEVEGHAEHRQLLLDRPEGFSTGLRGLLEWGVRQPPSRVAMARGALQSWQASLRATAAAHAALLTPVAPRTAARFDAGTPWNEAAFTALGSVAGLPAVAVPAGVDPLGLPVGLQVLARTNGRAERLARRLLPLLPRMAPPPACAA